MATIGAYFQLARSDGDVFGTSLLNDLLINTNDGSENILIGPYTSVDGTLLVTSNNITVHGSVRITDDIVSTKHYLNVVGITVSNNDIHSADIFNSNITNTDTITTSNLDANTAAISNLYFNTCQGSNLTLITFTNSNATITTASIWDTTCSNIESEVGAIGEASVSNLYVTYDAEILGSTRMQSASASNIDAIAITTETLSTSNAIVNVLTNNTFSGSNASINTIYNTSLTSSSTLINTLGASNVTIGNLYNSNFQCRLAAISNATIPQITNSSFVSSNASINAFTASNATIDSQTVWSSTMSNLTLSNLVVNTSSASNITCPLSTLTTIWNSHISGSNAFFETLSNTTVFSSNMSASNIIVHTLIGNQITLSNITNSNISSSNAIIQKLTVNNSTFSNIVVNSLLNDIMSVSNLTCVTQTASNTTFSNVWAQYAAISNIAINAADTSSLNTQFLTVPQYGQIQTLSNQTFASSNATISNLRIFAATISNITTPQLTTSNINSQSLSNSSTMITNTISAFSLTTFSNAMSNITANSATIGLFNSLTVRASNLNVVNNTTLSNVTCTTLSNSTVSTSNLDTITLTASNAVFSNLTLIQFSASNVNTPNLVSNTITNTSNITTSNLIVNALLSTSNANLITLSNTTLTSTTSRITNLTASNVTASNANIPIFLSSNVTASNISNVTIASDFMSTRLLTTSNLTLSNLLLANTLSNTTGTIVLSSSNAALALSNITTTNITTSTFKSTTSAIASSLTIGSSNLSNTPLDVYSPIALYNKSSQSIFEHMYTGYSNNTVFIRAANASNGIDFGICSNAVAAPGSTLNIYRSIMNINTTSNSNINGVVTINGNLQTNGDIKLANSDITKQPNFQVQGFVSSDKASDPLQYGLVTHFVFDDIDEKIIDRSKQCNHATVIGNAYTRTNTLVGKAFHIVDATGVIAFNNPITPAVSTVSFWFYNNALLNQTYGTLLSSSLNRFVHLAWDKESSCLCVGKGVYPYDILPYKIKMNTWYHFCLVMQNSQCDLYINGTFVTKLQGYLDIGIYPISRIGNNSTNDMAGFGLYADFRMYNRILTSNELVKLFNATSPSLKSESQHFSRKLVLYEDGTAYDTNSLFYGMGTSNNQLLYQVPSGASHVFNIATESNVSTAVLALRVGSDANGASNITAQFANDIESKRVIFKSSGNNDYEYFGLCFDPSVMGFNIASSNDAFAFNMATSSNTTRQLMCVNQAGVGIFQSNPSYALDVTGDIRCTGRMIADNSNNYWYRTSPSESNILTNYAIGVGTSNIIATLTVNGNIYASDGVVSLSDSRFKKEIQPITNALDTISLAKGYTYIRTDDPLQKRVCGVLAQELQPIIPEVVYESSGGDFSVSYGNLVAYLIEAIKELKSKYNELEQKLRLI